MHITRIEQKVRDKSEGHTSPQNFVFSIWNVILINLLARLIWMCLLNL